MMTNPSEVESPRPVPCAQQSVRAPNELTPHARTSSDDLDGKRFVRSLEEAASRHRAVRHPLLLALAEGCLPDEHATLVEFAQSYPGYASHFPRYLTATISRLEDPRHRAWLLDNLQEESGSYEEEKFEALAAAGLRREWFEDVTHPELFERFARALGVSPEDRAPAEEVVCWREMFYQVLVAFSPAQAIGALGLGTEWIVGSIYEPFAAAVRRHPGLSGRAAVFFPLHTAVDEQHQATLRAIAVEMSRRPDYRIDLRRGMTKALNLRANYWDWLQDRVPRPTTERRVS